jgi:hypothetical protein
MNIFAEGIVKYETSTKVPGIHNILMFPPLPLGSMMKRSRFCLDNDEQLTPEMLDKLRHELFIDCRTLAFSKVGAFVHIIAAQPIIIPPEISRRNLWLHIVTKDLFHLVENKEEYEWWQLTEEEKTLLDNRKLVA